LKQKIQKNFKHFHDALLLPIACVRIKKNGAVQQIQTRLKAMGFRALSGQRFYKEGVFVLSRQKRSKYFVYLRVF
jgi:hypothetical protein